MRKYATEVCVICKTEMGQAVIRPVLIRISGEDNLSPNRSWSLRACRSCRNELAEHVEKFLNAEGTGVTDSQN